MHKRSHTIAHHCIGRRNNNLHRLHPPSLPSFSPTSNSIVLHPSAAGPNPPNTTIHTSQLYARVRASAHVKQSRHWPAASRKSPQTLLVPRVNPRKGQHLGPPRVVEGLRKGRGVRCNGNEVCKGQPRTRSTPSFPLCNLVVCGVGKPARTQSGRARGVGPRLGPTMLGKETRVRRGGVGWKSEPLVRADTQRRDIRR